MDNEKLPRFYDGLFYNSLETDNQISGILFVEILSSVVDVLLRNKQIRVVLVQMI